MERKDEQFYMDLFLESVDDTCNRPEDVTLPSLRISNKRYLSHILCYENPNESGINKMLQEYFNIRDKIDSAKGKTELSEYEFNKRVLDVAKALFIVSEERERYFTEEQKEVSSDQMQTQLAFLMIKNILSQQRDDEYSPRNRNLRDELIHISQRTQSTLNSFLLESGDSSHFAKKVYGIWDTYESDILGHQRIIDERLRARDITALELPNSLLYKRIDEISDVFLKYFPVLNNTKILRKLVDRNEIANTVCAALVPEILYDGDLRKDLVTIVKSDAPAQMKFIVSLMYLASDNAKRAGKLALKTTLEGYKK